MKRRIAASVLSLSMVLGSLTPMTVMAAETQKVTVGDQEIEYSVELPDDYETSGMKYPVVYVLPEDGLTVDTTMTTALKNAESGMDMIIVSPELKEGIDVNAALDAVVADVDADYRTLADIDHRALVGAGEGGYLAYAVGLTDAEGNALTAPDVFKSIASVRGDYVGDNNEWIDTYGDVYDLLKGMGSANVANFYTYLDAPADDSWSTLDKSSNEIGSMMIGFGLELSKNEFTVRPGSYDAAFINESANRIADRLTSTMLDGLATGTISLSKTALTSSEASAEVTYSATITDKLASFVDKTSVEVVVSVVDPETNEVLASASETGEVEGTGEFAKTITIDNKVNGNSSNVVLSVKLLGAEIELATATLVRVQDTTNEHIDLMGDWYFHFTGNKDGLNVAALTESKEYTSWSVVQPGLAWWTQGFGDVTSRYPGAYFDYGIIGDGYYAKTFEVPADFSSGKLVVSIGNLDDRGEAYINGQLIGATGMKDGKSDGESAWEEYSSYEIDSSILNIGGTNTIFVRCQNDGMGGGGWYSGPVGVYSEKAFAEAGIESRFEELTFDSKYAALALGAETETVENKYLVYLPDDYEESDKYYPTLYLLHQYNSTHKSYMTDDVDQLISQAAKAGIIDDMIVVVPNSEESSWWAGNWQKMITEELIPLIDSEYRTIQDARYRFTAGCSMGGQGAMSVALGNPDMFSGAVSFFGALSMPRDGVDALAAAETESAEFFDYYALYFICGNQDIYKFGQPAITLDKTLTEKGVEHEFFIDNGAHDSAFYLPHFIEGLEYARNNMYKSDAGLEDVISGYVYTENDTAIVGITVDEGIEEYMNVVPESTYTKDTNPGLNVILTVEVSQDGEVVYTETVKDILVNPETGSIAYKYDLADVVDTDKEYTVSGKLAVLDRTMELGDFVLPFEDVKEGDWFYDAVKEVYLEGTMNGASDTKFDPNAELTRGQFVTVLYRMDGAAEVEYDGRFTDVDGSLYYADAIMWASENKITTGTSATTFDPEAKVTRQQMVTFLYRYISDYKGEEVSKDADLSAYTDAKDIAPYAADAFAWAVANGVISGTSETTLSPEKAASRAMCAAIIARMD